MNDKPKVFMLFPKSTLRLIVLVVTTMALVSWFQVQVTAHVIASNNEILIESKQLHSQNNPEFAFPYSLNDVRGLVELNSDLKITLFKQSNGSAENTQLLENLVNALNASTNDLMKILELAVDPYFIMYQSSWWIVAILMLSVLGTFIGRRFKRPKLVSLADNKQVLFLLAFILKNALFITTH